MVEAGKAYKRVSSVWSGHAIRRVAGRGCVSGAAVSPGWLACSGALAARVCQLARRPLAQAAADVCGVETQHITDAREGERPILSVGHQPALGLPKEAPARSVAGAAILPKAE